MKRVVYGILVFLWLGLIFYFSAQTGEVSKKLTTTSISAVLSTTEKKEDKISSTQPEKEVKIIDILIKPVRKSAHFFEYMILGILVFLFLKEWNISFKKLFWISLGFCIFYACTDEIHQLFVEGRTARLFDVFVDSMGASLGIGILYCIKRKKVKNENRQ